MKTPVFIVLRSFKRDSSLISCINRILLHSKVESGWSVREHIFCQGQMPNLKKMTQFHARIERFHLLLLSCLSMKFQMTWCLGVILQTNGTENLLLPQFCYSHRVKKKRFEDGCIRRII